MRRRVCKKLLPQNHSLRHWAKDDSTGLLSGCAGATSLGLAGARKLGGICCFLAYARGLIWVYAAFRMVAPREAANYDTRDTAMETLPPMYQYNDFDKAFVSRAVRLSFATSLDRWQTGRLSEDDFRPLRLQNGWYVQRHAPMLRVAVPYGGLSSAQLRALARIAREYDAPVAEVT